MSRKSTAGSNGHPARFHTAPSLKAKLFFKIDSIVATITVDTKGKDIWTNILLLKEKNIHVQHMMDIVFQSQLPVFYNGL